MKENPFSKSISQSKKSKNPFTGGSYTDKQKKKIQTFSKVTWHHKGKKLSGIKKAELVREQYPVVDVDWIKKGDKVLLRHIASFSGALGGPRPMESTGKVVSVDGLWVNMKNGKTNAFCYKPWIFEATKL